MDLIFQSVDSIWPG